MPKPKRMNNFCLKNKEANNLVSKVQWKWTGSYAIDGHEFPFQNKWVHVFVNWFPSISAFILKGFFLNFERFVSN